MKKRTRERRPKPRNDRRPEWQRDLYDGWAFEAHARELDRRRTHGHMRGRRNGSRRDWRRRIWRRAVRAMVLVQLVTQYQQAVGAIWGMEWQWTRAA